jgi:hypothetical protein
VRQRRGGPEPGRVASFADRANAFFHWEVAGDQVAGDTDAM